MILVLFLFYLCNAQNVKEYLQNYGFFTESNNSEITNVTEQKIENALLLFQSCYNLPEDGKANEETLELMRRPRCGVSDNTFTIYREKWGKNKLRWYFATSKIQMKNIAESAFQAWQNVCNLTFEYDYHKPDIIISMTKNGEKEHKGHSLCLKNTCPWSFDGEGEVLAHAFFPNKDTCLEIHLDSAEDWDVDAKSQTPTSLYAVLLHEIGHTLGLHHSSDNTSIMYPLYGNTKLSQDDITGIQYLYSSPPPPPPPLPSSTTPVISTKSVAPTLPQPKQSEDLCDIDVRELSFLVLYENLYIFHKTWIWIMNLETRNFTTRRLDIRNMLYGTTKFNSISAIYQRPNGEILLFVNKLIYFITYPSYLIRLQKDMSF